MTKTSPSDMPLDLDALETLEKKPAAKKPAKIAQPAPTPRTVMEGTPETIYLQTGGGDDPEITFDQLGEVTWCADPAERDDTKYIRADIAERELSAKTAEAERLREALTVHLSHYSTDGYRIPTDEFMREVVKESRAALAATRKEKGNG